MTAFGWYKVQFCLSKVCKLRLMHFTPCAGAEDVVVVDVDVVEFDVFVLLAVWLLVDLTAAIGGCVNQRESMVMPCYLIWAYHPSRYITIQVFEVLVIDIVAVHGEVMFGCFVL